MPSLEPTTTPPQPIGWGQIRMAIPNLGDKVSSQSSPFCKEAERQPRAHQVVHIQAPILSSRDNWDQDYLCRKFGNLYIPQASPPNSVLPVFTSPGTEMVSVLGSPSLGWAGRPYPLVHWLLSPILACSTKQTPTEVFTEYTASIRLFLSSVHQSIFTCCCAHLSQDPTLNLNHP